MSRSLLLVTQAFPPASGSNVQRGAKLVKYLLRDGWSVRVATVDPGAWPDRDPSSLREVEGARVRAARAVSFPGVRHIAIRAMPDLLRGVRALFTAPPAARPGVMLMTSPDVHWFPLARAARSAAVPFVLDYPDPWTVLPADFRLFTPSKLRSRAKWVVAPWLERRVVSGAAAATFATAPILAAYREAFPALRAELLPNGFDPEDFVASRPPGRADGDGRLRLVHVGSFAGPRSPLPAARVLRDAVTRLGVDPATAELVLVGAGADRARRELTEILGEVRLRIRGWVPHAEAIGEMQEADVLWLDAMVHLRSAATAKVYEYLASGRPIVGLAHPRSPATELVERFSAGRLAADEAGAAAALTGMVSDGVAASVDRIGDLGEFDRSHLARRMSSLLEQVAR